MGFLPMLRSTASLDSEGILNFISSSPAEVKIVVYAKLFCVDLEVATRMATRVPVEFIMQEIIDVIEVCPVIIGNRTLSFDEIIRLKATDRITIIEISEPTLLSHNSEALTTFRKLNKLPDYVKRGMVISRPTLLHCAFFILPCSMLVAFGSLSIFAFVENKTGPAFASLGLSVIGLFGMMLMIVKGWCECEFMNEFTFSRYEFDENGRLV